MLSNILKKYCNIFKMMTKIVEDQHFLKMLEHF
jgi:hypothetical protein